MDALCCSCIACSDSLILLEFCRLRCLHCPRRRRRWGRRRSRGRSRITISSPLFHCPSISIKVLLPTHCTAVDILSAALDAQLSSGGLPRKKPAARGRLPGKQAFFACLRFFIGFRGGGGGTFLKMRPSRRLARPANERTGPKAKQRRKRVNATRRNQPELVAEVRSHGGQRPFDSP